MLEIKVYCETHDKEELYILSTDLFLGNLEIKVQTCEKCLDELAKIYEPEE